MKHEAQLTWAMDKINEARRERDELRSQVEELNERIVELTTRLHQGENQIRNVERICTFHASDFRTTTIAGRCGEPLHVDFLPRELQSPRTCWP